MNKDKIAEAIIDCDRVTYKGKTYVIDGVWSFIRNGQWHNKLLLFDSREGKMKVAEVKEVSGGEFV